MARPDCPHCDGTGWKVVERTTQGAQALAADRPGGAAGDPKLVWAVPCECTVDDRTERIFSRARIPERYRHCDFENFDTDLPYDHEAPTQVAAWNRSLEEARMIVQGFARDFPVGSEHGLLLMGTCGVGKTHLAVEALHEIVKRGHSCLFYDYRELLKEIQDSYNPENQATEMGVLDPVLKTEVLLLDDLGASKPSMWALETVGHILNARYNDKRVTVITTNYLDSVSEMVRPAARPSPLRPTAVEDSLSERIGSRIRSRLYEMCRTIEVSAPDYRKEIRQVGRGRA